jgi:hypothetical protein
LTIFSVGLAIFCAFLLGFGDCCWNTQIYSILIALYRHHLSAQAFALMKFFQVIKQSLDLLLLPITYCKWSNSGWNKYFDHTRFYLYYEMTTPHSNMSSSKFALISFYTHIVSVLTDMCRILLWFLSAIAMAFTHTPTDEYCRCMLLLCRRTIGKTIGSR